MILAPIDWLVIALFFMISLGIGIWYARKDNKNIRDYFAASGNMPWWLLGISMVATTFAADTPNLVAELVREKGVAGNWSWWAFLLSGILTVFVYARLWKQSGVLTDMEFYELRYSGRISTFLRGFRAIYLGLILNVIIMATVTLAAVKMGSVLLGLEAWQTVLIAGSVTLIYSVLGGLKGILATDLIQFFIAVTGAFIAAWFALEHPAVGGLEGLMKHPDVLAKKALFPSPSNPELFISVLLVPLLVQWWATWYPGSEPGGGGYVAQRMFAAKDSSNALQAVLLFNIAHYALRPWPWIIVGLASIVVFPTLDSIGTAFPQARDIMGNDLGYPAMLTFVPNGWLGIVVTSLIAAFMSTLSTHLNWGASYLTNDFYKRFISPESSEQKLLIVGRLFTALLMVLTMALALAMRSALDAFYILLQIGAGTGLLFLLRWFWWRINAAAELGALLISLTVALYFRLINPYQLESWEELLIGLAITTIGWILITLVTKPTDETVLQNFVYQVNPGGPGWKRFSKGSAKKHSGGSVLLYILAGITGIYAMLLGTGWMLYGDYVYGLTACFIALTTIVFFVIKWKNVIQNTKTTDINDTKTLTE